MVPFAVFLWVYVSSVLTTLFSFFIKIILRLKENISYSIKNNNGRAVISAPDYSRIDSEPETEQEDVIPGSDDDRTEENESPTFVGFHFTRYEEFVLRNKENIADSPEPGLVLKKDELVSKKDFTRFIEEQQGVSFNVNYIHADDSNYDYSNEKILSDKFVSESKIIRPFSQIDPLNNDTYGSYKHELEEKLEEELVEEKDKLVFSNKYELILEKDLIGFMEEPQVVNFNVKELSNYDGLLSETEIVHQNCQTDHPTDNYTDSNSKDELEKKLKEVSGEDNSLTSDIDVQFLSERKFNVASQSDSNLMCSSENYTLRDMNREELVSKPDVDIMEGFQKLYSDTTQLPAKDSEHEEELRDKNEDGKEKQLYEDSDHSNGLETLWEHQDLIEQIKMEMKKVRVTGLPTILEESESPKIVEDLKPWIFDLTFHYEDRMNELRNFYKSYRERMKKLDIFNHQKMYARGFFQSKDLLQSISSGKSTTPALASLLSQNLGLQKNKRTEDEPRMKFIRELQSDLEMVYIGQLCLSWEILHWQYQKALELWESDPKGYRRYDEVAGEFQQLQVLMQRFIENEPFDGPRVQNYVKSRCINRNLLQVPVIREDSMKDKTKVTGRRGDNGISSGMLVEVMEESIRIFWRFVRADKYSHNVPQLQDPSDSALLREVRTDLQKKEKKLKDILRSGNCILKLFQKQNESESDQVLYFFSQVDMKLVSRVLNMSRITSEQLVWCSNKLSKISFVNRNRKIRVETLFSLFPC